MNWKFPRIILVYLLAIFTMTCLHLFGTEHVPSSSMLPGDQSTEEWEDSEYWVLIRNVSIFDGVDNLTEDMSVLVIGKHIHKIGTVPIVIIDKDLTYNFDGEGRILMGGFIDNHGDSGRSQMIKEGLLANIMVVDETSMEGLTRLLAGVKRLDKQKIEDLDAIKVIMKNGWVTKDTLPIKRIEPLAKLRSDL